MVGRFAEYKALCRQTVHDVLAVSALYSDSTLSQPVPITARYHTKLALMGNLDHQGYAQVIEGLKYIIFNRPEVTSLGLTLRQRGTVTFPDYGISLVLDVLDEHDDQIEIKWSVVKAD